MKKKVFISILAVFIISISALFGHNIWQCYQPGSDDPYVDTLNYLNNDMNVKILFYGEDDIPFHKDMEYTKIQLLDKETLMYDNNYIYLLINDLNGKLNVTEEQIQFLLNYANKNTNFNFYYIGTSAFPYLKSNLTDFSLDDTNKSFGYIIYSGDRLQDYGLWKNNDNEHYKNNPALLGESIIDNIFQNIKSNKV